ncbi:hypothetical protein ABM34_00840 [Companilactobacillus ginsenosidimutans]|uniref:Uncharacterized protein n=1 Tax=Companilactobacillus ginsenosidimutans TaxID=1007676 RepID=A0A0H4QE76_9LACO|nr:hypothetical protein ABM34_00840 [Companilactobacillus ginsenosidimutans]
MVHFRLPVKFGGGRGRCEHDSELFHGPKNLGTRFSCKPALWQANMNATARAPAELYLQAGSEANSFSCMENKHHLLFEVTFK